MNALAILDDLCRLCLSETGVENIFYPVNLTNDIFIITGVKVLESDAFPQTLCKKCLNTLNDAQKLRSISQKNNERLMFLIDGKTSCDKKEVEHEKLELIQEKHEPKADLNNKNTPSSSKITSTLKIEEISDVESDVTVESLLKHKKKKHSSSRSDRNCPFKCNKCKKTFSTRKKLSLHSRTHNRSFICPLDVCGKTFASKNDLKKHIRCHTGERPYKCTLCEKSFTQNVTLKNHKMSVHCIFD